MKTKIENTNKVDAWSWFSLWLLFTKSGTMGVGPLSTSTPHNAFIHFLVTTTS